MNHYWLRYIMILSRSIIIWISIMSEFCLLRTKWQEAVSLRNILTQHNLQLFCQERYHAFIQTDSFSIICVNLEHWSVRRLSHDLLVTIPGIKRTIRATPFITKWIITYQKPLNTWLQKYNIYVWCLWKQRNHTAHFLSCICT